MAAAKFTKVGWFWPPTRFSKAQKSGPLLSNMPPAWHQCLPRGNQQFIKDTDPYNWKYYQTLIMMANFKAEHLYDRQTDRQVWLMDGLGFIVSQLPYHEYLVASHYPIECVGNNDFPKRLEIIPGIGIWHVHGHQLQFFSTYAPLYIKGAG
ncbi:hypothetical protein BS17DRAFT_766844 [Gyrodon lividus]|nr:hypothetical protein BS17DRAFT_766844 [Gyrodon lividus]